MTVAWRAPRDSAQRRACAAAWELTSVIAMCEAPETRAISAHIPPIGPNPRNGHGLPGEVGDLRRVHRVAERVQERADAGRNDVRSSGTTLKAGTTTYWAKQPSPWTPRIFVCSQMWRCPVRQGRQ
jgi:hypothetical protein